MVELPMHPLLDDNVVYIVGKTGAGKTTLAREIIKYFNGPKAVVAEIPEEYEGIDGIKFFEDWGAALRHFETLNRVAEKLLIIDENRPIDVGKFRPSNTTVIILSQKYEDYMRGHTIIFMKMDRKELEKTPLSNESRKTLEKMSEDFAILYNGKELPIVFSG